MNVKNKYPVTLLVDPDEARCLAKVLFEAGERGLGTGVYVHPDGTDPERLSTLCLRTSTALMASIPGPNRS